MTDIKKTHNSTVVGKSNLRYLKLVLISRNKTENILKMMYHCRKCDLLIDVIRSFMPIDSQRTTLGFEYLFMPIYYEGYISRYR